MTVATTRAGTVGRPNVERLNKSGEILVAEQRSTVLGQQPIDTALGQLLTHQQHRVIESALPVSHPNATHRSSPRQIRSDAPKPGSLNQRR
jgi:hypothetical protein